MIADTCATIAAFGSRGVAAQVVNSAGSYTYMVSPWSIPPSVSTVSLPVNAFGAGAFSEAFSIGGGPAFLEVRNPNTIFELNLDTGAVASPPSSLQAEAPVAVSDGALALDLGSTSGFGLSKADGTWTHLQSPNAPHLLTALAVDRASSQQVVWVEGDYDSNAGAYVNTVLWTSGYSTTPAGISAKAVASFTDALGRGGTWGLVANAGVVLNLIDQSTALLTRLSDGQGWTIAAEAQQGFIEPLWADDNEVWIATAPTNVNSWSSWSTGILRVQRSTLGAPTAPSGL